MSDTFDPFSADDGTADNQNTFTAADALGAGGFTDATFDDSTPFDFAPTPVSAAVYGGGLAGDEGVDEEDNEEEDFPAFPSPSRRHMIPVSVALHEEMSCVYDGVSNTSSLSIEGIVSVKSSVALEGKSIALTLTDPDQHVDKLSFDASIVSEVGTRGTGGGKSNHSRVFSVTLPESDSAFPPNVDVRCIKYNCSSSLVPVPVLVQSKVKVAGKFCRVAIKIRSNPANKYDLSNVAIMMAVPPDLDGETVKMSKQGGIWDKMKRTIAWSAKSIKPGETKELQIQMQFESERDDGSDNSNDNAPSFPVLLRFDTKNTVLSSVHVDLGDPSADEFVFEEYAMKLTKSFRVMHRKV